MLIETEMKESRALESLDFVAVAASGQCIGAYRNENSKFIVPHFKHVVYQIFSESRAPRKLNSYVDSPRRYIT